MLVELAGNRRGHAEKHFLARIFEIAAKDRSLSAIGMDAKSTGRFCVSYWSGRAFGSRHGEPSIVKEELQSNLPARYSHLGSRRVE